MKNVRFKMRLWFEDEQGRIIFGPGRALLLQKVKECGSLNKAAKELGMSYRAAWGKIKASEEVLNQKLLAKTEGSKSFTLTEIGLQILEKYENWRNSVYEFAQKEANFFPKIKENL